MGRTAQICVTPLLWLGPALDVPYRSVDTAQAAVAAMEDGVPALLPADDWGTALEALRLSGLGADDALDRIHHARTGHCLLADDSQFGALTGLTA